MNYSVAVPVFNEKNNINNLFRAILRSQLIKDRLCKYIIFVDDGSNDDSQKKITKYIFKSKKFILLYHKKNLGYGAALKTAIKFAKKKTNYIVFIDSDLTNPISDIKKIIPFMKKNVDFIQGNRYGKSLENISYYRKLIGNFGNLISRLFVNLKLKDYTNGFRSVKISLYLNIKLHQNDFSIIMEEKFKLKKYIKSVSEFSTKLTSRKKKIRKSSFNYSVELIFKYFIYCIFSFFVRTKDLKKVE
jgi:glycosyltransferase involved in cell wall biosynthesis